MITHRGSLTGIPYVVRVVERADELSPFIAWAGRQTGTVAFDTETYPADGIYSHGPEFVRLAQFGTETEAWVIPAELGPNFRRAIADVLRRLPDLCGHDVIRYDCQVADRHLGVTIEELAPKMFDTIISAKLIDPRSANAGGIGHGLKPQSAHYIDPEAPDTQAGLEADFKALKVGHTKDNPVGWIHIPLFHERYTHYAGLDVILNSRLKTAHDREMKRVGVRMALLPYEHNISRICAIMSRTGMAHDRAHTESLYEPFGEITDKWKGVAARYGVVNINARSQIQTALAALGAEWGPDDLTAKGARSVGGDTLLRFAGLDDKWEQTPAPALPTNDLAEAILRAQRAGKWTSSYLDKFMRYESPEGRIHVAVNTLEARTGRMSITGALAAQTLPAKDWMIRRSLMADEGHRIISTDFDGVELRVLAAVAGVKRMKEAFTTGDGDLHSMTARLIWGENFTKAQRKIAKAINFLIVYGGGAKKLARQTGMALSDAQAVIKSWHRAYPEIRQFGNRKQREAFDNGMVVRSLTGRLLVLDRDRTYAITNYCVQSPARDCLGQSLIEMDSRGLTPYLRLPVHDEVIASAPEATAHEVAAEIGECMNFDLMGVPITATPEVGGRSWGSLYMKDERGKPVPELLIEKDPYFADHPSEAYAAA